jgi:hypothetical protein
MSDDDKDTKVTAEIARVMRASRELLRRLADR